MSDHPRRTIPAEAPPVSLAWTSAAIAVTLVGIAGSLWLSLGMKLKACPLCLYQRTFLMAAGGVLLVALLTPLRRTAFTALLALPSAVGGLGVAAFHVSLELRGILECPDGLLGIGTAPQQSLTVFVILVAILAATACRKASCGAALATAVLGILFAAGTIVSAPPMPAAPAAPYEEPLTVCRPPFRAI